MLKQERVKSSILLAIVIAGYAILLTFENCNENSQVRSQPEAKLIKTLGNIRVSPSLEPYFHEFRIEAFKRGVEVDSLLKKYVNRVILTDELEYPVIGLYLRDHNIVLVTNFTLMDKKIVRRVLYHELGHALTTTTPEKIHQCDNCGSIMDSYAPSTFSYLYDEEVWDAEVDELMYWIEINKRK